MDDNKQGCVTRDAIVSQSRELVAADMDGEVALMSVDSGKYYCLNPTGCRIWRLIEQPRSITEVCAVLHSEFDVELKQCESEVLSHIAHLAEENLIEVVHGANA